MVPVVSGILIRFCAGMNQSSIEIYRTMYLTHSSLLYYFIECSTCYGQVSYLLQLNLLSNIKSKKLPSAAIPFYKGV